MTDSTQKFEIDAEQAKAALQQLIGAAKQFDEAIKKAGESGDDTGKKIPTRFERAAAAVKKFGKQVATSGTHLVALAGAATAATVAIQKMAVEGEKAQAVAKSFAALGAKAGDLEKLRRATGNMVDDTTLQKSYNLAKFFGLNTDSLGTLTKVAQGAANALGTDMGTALNDLMTAISRKSKPILDNLGITIRNLDVVYKEYAQSIGVADHTKLTEDQKTAAFQAEALASAQKQLNLASLDVEKSARQAQAAWENFKSELASGAVEIFADIWEGLQKISEAAREAARQFADVGIGDRAGLLEAQNAADEAQKRWARVNKELARTVDGYTGATEGSKVWQWAIEGTRKELFNAALTLERWKSEGRDLTEAQEQFDRIRRRLEEMSGAQREFNNETREYASLLAGVITDATKGEVQRLKDIEQRERELAAARKRRHAERMRQLEKEREALLKYVKAQADLIGQDLLGRGGGFNAVAGGISSANGRLGPFIAEMQRAKTEMSSLGSALQEPAIQAERDAFAERIQGYKELVGAKWELIKINAQEIAAEEAKRAAILSASKDAVGGVMDAVAGQIFGVQELAAIKGAFQLGEGLAAAVTPGMQAAAPGHFASAAQYFLAAATSGGGGGGGGAPASSGTTRSEGPRREMERLDRQGRGGDINVTIENKGWEIRDQDAIRLGDLFERGRELGVRGMGWR